MRRAPHPAVQVAASETPILVASTGGHLEQLHVWAGRWNLLGGGAHWVTFETPQSIDLLSGEEVTFIPYVEPRDLAGTLRSARRLIRLVRALGSRVLVSTGAAVAVSAALAGAVTRQRVVYIESLARVHHLSLTGRILTRFPRVERFVQSPSLVGNRFAYAGTVLDAYAVEESLDVPLPRRVFVTVGTIRPYGFDRLLQRLDTLLSEHEVTWQIGSSSYRPSHGAVHHTLERSEVLTAMAEADVVISHAGVGSILSALSQGKVPVVVPRESQHGEHVDDHQFEIAVLAAATDLSVYATAQSISLDDLLTARRRIVHPAPEAEAEPDDA